MCGRFTITASVKELIEHYGLEPQKVDWTPNYNAAPTQNLPILTNDEPKKLTIARWGLIPSWAKDVKIGYKLINARSETIASKPSFARALEKRRCLIPADSFFEWKKEGTKKIPMRFQLPKNQIFSFAGLWEHWKRDNQDIVSFTIITTKPNETVQKIHDRMPVILTKKQEKTWLTEPHPDLLQPFQGKMEVYQVSDKLNSPRNNDESLLLKVA